MPADTRANDLWYWQTTLITNDVQAIRDRLRESGVQFVTPDVVLNLAWSRNNSVSKKR